ncbi:MAG: hypothetical protein LUD72_03905 [Bacteroidales bacterium]|nr:hypothetical protein [Bacteroidales bacterium]
MNDASFNEDWKYSFSFMDEMTAILGQVSLTDRFDIEDRERDSDLMMLQWMSQDYTHPLRLGLRVRRPDQFCRIDKTLGVPYAKQYTHRTHKFSGAKTEFEKMVKDGYGNYMLYAFANNSNECLKQWVVIDLKAFRDIYFPRLLYNKKLDRFGYRISDHSVIRNVASQWNNRSSSRDDFIAINRDMVPLAIIASSNDWDENGNPIVPTWIKPNYDSGEIIVKDNTVIKSEWTQTYLRVQ